MTFELSKEERDAVVGAIHLRLKTIGKLSEPHHIAETNTLFQATKKLGLELIKDPESGEITVKIA